MERAQTKNNELQLEKETPQAGTNKRHKVALLNENRALIVASSSKQQLIKDENVQKAISTKIEAEEHATENQPVEKGVENITEVITKEYTPRGGGQAKFFRHKRRVVDFTKGPCREMNEKEIESLGIEGLAIVGTKYGKNAMEQAQEDHVKEDGPQVCRKVETGKKVPTHERHDELDYQHTTAENLMVAIYQCMADLRKFDNRYEDEAIMYECNMRTKLQKQFHKNLVDTTQKFKEYIRQLNRDDERTNEELRKKYSETMERTRQASALLDREIRGILTTKIDKLSYPSAVAIEDQDPNMPHVLDGNNRSDNTSKEDIAATSGKIRPKKRKNDFIVNVDALRKWAKQNEIKGPPNAETQAELVLNPSPITATMNNRERDVLRTINVNLKNSEKGQAIADEIKALQNMVLEGGYKTTLTRIANKLDIQTRYTNIEGTPKYKSYQRLLEADLMPMVVFFGTGQTRQAADDMASQIALGYLRNQLEAKDPARCIHYINDEEEKEIVVLQVVDADKCNAAITQDRKAPLKKLSHTLMAIEQQRKNGDYNDAKPKSNETNNNSKLTAAKIKTKGELKRLDTHQSDSSASSLDDSNSNMSVSSVDYNDYSGNESPIPQYTKPKTATDRPRSFMLNRESEVISNERSQTGMRHDGKKQRQYGKESKPPDEV